MIQSYLLLVLLLLAVVESSWAFQGMSLPSFRDSATSNPSGDSTTWSSSSPSSSSSILKWSLSLPDVPLPKSTWWDEANPTARTIVYDDEPYDFQFSSVGSSWPVMSDSHDDDGPNVIDTGRVGSSQTSTKRTDTVSQRRRVGPLRRAGKWIRRRF